jgi:uncharacterized membrane protein YidH (DUF202 family)
VGEEKRTLSAAGGISRHTFSVAKEEIITDTNVVDRLILIGIALVVIGIGAAITYTGNYLATPEHKKQMVAKLMRIHGVIFVALGLAYLIYCFVALR